MKKYKNFVIALCVMVLLSTTANAGVDKIWSAQTSREYYYIGGDRISLGVLRFNTSNWRDIGYISKKIGNAPKMNFKWDDKWYYEKLPDSTNEVLVLFFKNHDTNKNGWLAIKNTPDTWLYRTNAKGWKGIKNGQVVNEYWKGYGISNTGDATGSLSIDVRNPENKGGWSANDIQIGFGK